MRTNLNLDRAIRADGVGSVTRGQAECAIRPIVPLYRWSGKEHWAQINQPPR
jgi:hypothetical protein